MFHRRSLYTFYSCIIYNITCINVIYCTFAIRGDRFLIWLKINLRTGKQLHILLDMWLPIHAEIEYNHVDKMNHDWLHLVCNTLLMHSFIIHPESLSCILGICIKSIIFINSLWTFSHYSDVIMGTMASQIISLTIVYSTVCSGPDQRNSKAPHHWLLWGEFTGDR